MSQQIVYQHKKFAAVKVEDYNHKKFGKHTMKRKLEDLQEEQKENLTPIITAQTILDLTAKGQTEIEQPLPKRKQTKPLFRPWLEETESKTAPLNPVNNTNSSQQPHKQIKEQQQQKRKRNQMPLNFNHHKQLAEQFRLQQQYNAYQYYQAAVVQQNVAQALYLRQLQQLALQRQGQLFVFGQK